MVSIDRYHDGWFNLTEAVNDTLHAKVGGGRRPCCANGRCCQHRDDSLGHVWHVATYPVALANAFGAQCLRKLGDRNVELSPRKAAFDLVLAPENQRVIVVITNQQVLGKVQTCVREKLCARHFVAIDQDALAPCFGLEVGELNDSRPKMFEFGNGPVIEFRETLEIKRILVVHPVAKAGDVCIFNAFFRRLPKQVAHDESFVSCRPYFLFLTHHSRAPNW